MVDRSTRAVSFWTDQGLLKVEGLVAQTSLVWYSPSKYDCFGPEHHRILKISDTLNWSGLPVILHTVVLGTDASDTAG